MYIDYDYFLRHYPKSTVTIEDFTLLAKKAQREIENAVNGGLTVNEDVKLCACELVNYMAEAGETTSADANISSESVGDYSRSFVSAGERRVNARTSKLDIIKFWLGKSGLNYRGVSRRVF